MVSFTRINLLTISMQCHSFSETQFTSLNMQKSLIYELHHCFEENCIHHSDELITNNAAMY